ncbi:hypothetical protein [Enterobacter roggenkampii]|uniref:hypothetical protein n=1 Tax=Enterobacter roggenkampii TaxID=1812935 RepID=UPI002A808A45|nr:hypothetical protein [Enterobacter roggenkampii]
MSNIDKQALTAESARESGNILLIVAARMARRELFTPLHYVSELPQKVVSMRVFREALERSEETLQREVCKIVDGHNRLQKKLKEAEAKLEAAEKRIAELEAIPKSVKFDPIPMEDLGNRNDGKRHPYMFGAGYNSAVVHCESVLLQAFAAAAGKGK